MAAPTQFAFRTSKGIGITDAAPVYESLPGFVRPEGNLRCCVYSPDGRYFAWASLDKVTIIDASVGHVISTIDAENVFELGFSPLGTFVITWQRPSKDENGDATKNLTVWRVAAGDQTNGHQDHIVGRFVQKSQTGWNLQYTQDEKYCARMVTNEIQFYESQNLSVVWNKLRAEGVADFAVSPGQSNALSVFVPERKGQPAVVMVYTVPNFAAPVSQKTFFKGDKVQLNWNQQGTSLLVLAQTEVDRSGKSYYGETTLYLLSANGGFDSRIDLDKEGPVHDVTWSPNSKEFGVVYGYMPAKTTIFNTKAVATHNFTLGPRNTILFSPHGRFVLVAGFGNLAGDMDIYDLDKDYQKVCTIKASNASVCNWSPDGQYLMTATTSPRLRVDNGVRVWHVTGGLMYNEDMNELYHVTWRPQLPSMHPLQDPLHAIPTPHASALAYLGNVKTPSKPTGAYRPPGARGTSTPLAFMREDQGGAAFVSNGSTSLGGGTPIFGKSRRAVPGAEPADEPSTPTDGGDENLSKTALKNKKKREAKKAKESSEKDGLGAVAEDPNSLKSPNSNRSPERRDRRANRSRANSELRPRSRNPSQQRRGSHTPRYPPGEGGPHNRTNGTPAKGHHARTPSAIGQQVSTPPLSAPPAAAAAAAAPPAATAAAPTPAPSADNAAADANAAATPMDKKIRALTKKLRAIDDLKMRRAAGEKLEGTQIKKMDTENSVRKELGALGWVDE